MLQVRAVVLATAFVMAPLGAQGADLVVWWEEGHYARSNEAVAEIIRAFEQDSGKAVELVQPTEDELFDNIGVALEAGRPPDFLFPEYAERWIAKWAYEDRLADLKGALGPAVDLFDPDTIEASALLNGSTGKRGLYALPMGRGSNHIHVWKSLLDQAGFALADIPKHWASFWEFWCDEVQPAVRQALDRDDVWGIGLPMSTAALDTNEQLVQFQLAYGAPWIGRDRRLQVDDATVRAGMVKALTDYTAIWRKGCTPPDSTGWDPGDNNQAFLEQTLVMTPNPSLSIPAALRTESPDDYYENVVTIDWPNGADGQPLVMLGFFVHATVFKAGGNLALAEDFVRFLIEDGWLAHWLSFAGDQFLPPMPKLIEQPFWLDTSDPHRLHAAVQILTQPHQSSYQVRDNEWRSAQIWDENVWGKAVYRVVTEGASPEQAVEEAIARIKEILGE